VTTASPQTAFARRGSIARHPVVCSVAAAHAFSWLAFAPWVLGEDGADLLPAEPSVTIPGMARTER
jgi:hypothetical protein